MKIDTQSRKKKEKSNIHIDENQACASLNTQLVGLLKRCCHKIRIGQTLSFWLVCRCQDCDGHSKFTADLVFNGSGLASVVSVGVRCVWLVCVKIVAGGSKLGCYLSDHYHQMWWMNTSKNHMYVVGPHPTFAALLSTLLSRCIEHLDQAKGDEEQREVADLRRTPRICSCDFNCRCSDSAVSRSFSCRPTCCRNGSKELERTAQSPVADEVELDELDLDRLVKGEVEQGGSFAPCVRQLILHQGLPRAILVRWARYLEIFCGQASAASLSPVLDLTASNESCARVQPQGEALPACLMRFCHPEVGLAIVQKAIFFTQDEDAACWVEGWVGSAMHHLWTQRAITIFCLKRMLGKQEEDEDDDPRRYNAL